MRVAFDRFKFDSHRRELLDATRPVHLAPKAFELLEILIASHPLPLAKGALQERIWPETYVAECNLAGLVNDLRVALGDSAREPRFIRTVHGFGYAFCGAVVGEVPRRPAGMLAFRNREMLMHEGINILGRDGSADVTIDDSTVSRRHASITLGAEEATIEDLASKNGTFIDGEPIHLPAPLHDGQTFVLGDAQVVFRRRKSSSTVTISRSRKARQ